MRKHKQETHTKSSESWEKRANTISHNTHMKLKVLFQSCRLTSRSQSSHSDLTVIVCFIIASAVMCFCIPVHACVSGTVGDRLTPCVWPIACVSSKDKQWRVERVICLLGLNSSPWSPAGLSSLPSLSLHAVLFWRWGAFLSLFACAHFSWCSSLWIYTVYEVCLLEDTSTQRRHSDRSHIDLLNKVRKHSLWGFSLVCFGQWS